MLLLHLSVESESLNAPLKILTNEYFTLIDAIWIQLDEHFGY